MFLLEAAHVGNIDSTYFVSIQATWSEFVSIPLAPPNDIISLFLFLFLSPSLSPSQMNACNATLRYLLSPLSAIYSTCILDLE